MVRDGDKGVLGREEVERGGVGEFGDPVGGFGVEGCVFGGGGVVSVEQVDGGWRCLVSG